MSNQVGSQVLVFRTGARKWNQTHYVSSEELWLVRSSYIFKVQLPASLHNIEDDNEYDDSRFREKN
jgi:hypothetical protein